MIICPGCRNKEYEGELFCSNCGARLWAGPGEMPTIALDSSRVPAASEPLLPTQAAPALRAGQISINLGNKAMVLEGRSEYVLGREGLENEKPDVNLGPYGGRERGVSRKHALLRVDRRQLLLTDLNSSNGTWLNGSQLSASEPIRLQSGDEVR
ncbi:MAG: FHA domain-containing protein, partial [Anaerolineales bacterium]